MDDLPEIKVSIVPLDTLIEDSSNANIGTERGLAMLEASLDDFGFIEAGTLDASSEIMNGNKRKRAIENAGSASVAIVDMPNSDIPVYIRYANYDLDSPDPDIRSKSRQAAYALNRIAQVSINFDPAQMRDDLSSGLDLSRLFDSAEIAALLHVELPPPTLDQLEETYGDTPSDEAFWPILKLRLPPDTFLLYKQLTEQLGAAPLEPPAARKGARGLKGAKRVDDGDGGKGLAEHEAFLALLEVARIALSAPASAEEDQEDQE